MEDKKAMLLQLDHDASDDVTAIICSGLKVGFLIYLKLRLFSIYSIYCTKMEHLLYCIFLDGLCIYLFYIQSLCIFAYFFKIIYNV